MDVLPDVCVASSPRLRHAHRLERTTCLGEPIDDVLIDHTMVLLLCANSERIGAGTCPCLNPRAYFLLGIYDEQYFRDGADLSRSRGRTGRYRSNITQVRMRASPETLGIPNL